MLGRITLLDYFNLLFCRHALAPVVMVKMDTTGPPEGTEETVKMAKMVLRSSIIFDKKKKGIKISLLVFPTSLNFYVTFHLCFYLRKSNLLKVSLKTSHYPGVGKD